MGASSTRRQFLKSSVIAAAGAAFSPLVTFSSSEQKFDILIRSASIADGLGGTPFQADIGIRGDRIAVVGNLSGANALTEIIGDGLIASPGFIDIHSHTDSGVIRNRRAESKVRQGVTTDVGGNCGHSPFPRLADGIDSPKSSADCVHIGKYIDEVNSAGAAVNTAQFAGQGTIRNLVLGNSARQPDQNELALMKELVAESLVQGAVGMSSGLEYHPSGFASQDEIIELCRVVAEHGAVYATHMRSEDEKLVEAVEEAVETARRTGVSLQISHLKAAGKPNWHKIDTVLEIIEKGRAEGLNIHCDRYPYLAYSTGMSFFYPGWAQEGGRKALTNRLKDRATRARMKSETMVKVDANGGWETVMVSNIRNDANSSYLGKRISEIAGEKGVDPYDFACDLLISEGGGVSIVGYGMSEENTDRIISRDYVMIGSDGYAMSIADADRGGQPHPRSFGTFPKAIRDYVYRKKLIPIGEMVRKMTALPAEKLGLSDRGIIREHMKADIVLLDPVTIEDKATYIDPWRYPAGIPHVIVNGVQVIADGEQTDAQPGGAVSP